MEYGSRKCFVCSALVFHCVAYVSMMLHIAPRQYHYPTIMIHLRKIPSRAVSAYRIRLSVNSSLHHKHPESCESSVPSVPYRRPKEPVQASDSGSFHKAGNTDASAVRPRGDRIAIVIGVVNTEQLLLSLAAGALKVCEASAELSGPSHADARAVDFGSTGVGWC